ncbi:MAG: pantoate--beta-alanine ligase [Rikenellaceae bacterium]
MKIVKTVADLRNAINTAKADGTIGFVPTMGALHNGHISLVKRCRKENDTVVVSVFVNPTQFNDKNDLKNYPRTEEADAKLLSDAGCDILFLPTVEEMYPEEDTRRFVFGELEQVMEGPLRPGHFNGVAQVVSKLFNFVSPTNAYFGEKDFQQLAIIRKMVEDMKYNINIVGCEIFRAPNGLALSSRNALLSKEQLETAPIIHMTISEATKLAKIADVEHVKNWVKEQIESCKGMKVDYFEIVNAKTLQPIDSFNDACQKRGCIAVKVGDIRLIDNIAFLIK